MAMSAEELRARGDWIAELRRLLQLGPAQQRDARRQDAAVAAKRRKTKEAVALVLDALAAGAKLAPDLDTSAADIRRVIFNAVDQMVADKVAGSEQGKSRLDAVEAFAARMRAEFTDRAARPAEAIDAKWQRQLNDAVEALRFEEAKKHYASATAEERTNFRRIALSSGQGQLEMAVDPAFGSALIEATARDDRAAWDDPARCQDRGFVAVLRKVYAHGTPAAKALIAARLLERPDGRQALAANPAFGAELLADCSADKLKTMDLDQMFGAGKAPVAAETLLTLVDRHREANAMVEAVDRKRFDPALFAHLNGAVDAATWNDEGAYKRGLGARACRALWNAGCHQEICTLIDQGLDTSRAARVDGDAGRGTYSNFVQPIQHVTSKLLRDVDALETAAPLIKANFNELRREVVPRMMELIDAEPEARARRSQALDMANALFNAGDVGSALVAMQTLAADLAEAGEPQRRQAFQARVAGIRTVSVQGLVRTPNYGVADVEGARKILAALEARDDAAREANGRDADNGAVTLTSWAAVKASPMIEDFTKDPGTIWGFEDVRLPFVQASHEAQRDAEQEAGPLRMMEIWDAVLKTFPQEAYRRMLDDPEGAAETFVEQALKGTVERYMAQGADAAQFRENFKREATAFIIEFAKRMPKGLIARDFVDVRGNTPQRPDPKFRLPQAVTMSDVMGVDQDKFLSSYACQVGLWSAKEQDKPVYYCLDGIDMKDVINHKEVKKRAIDEFIDNGGQPEGARTFSDVVTMKELRTILKDWDDLRRKDGSDLVKFYHKGVELKGPALQQQVQEWRQALLAANARVVRPKAPPRATFARELDALDPTLMARLPDGDDGDKDARDIVKKASYLSRVARTRPAIVLKYVTSRCVVLERHGLLSPQLADAAAAFAKADAGNIDARRRALSKEIGKCHPSFQAGLTASLMSAVERERALAL